MPCLLDYEPDKSLLILSCLLPVVLFLLATQMVLIAYLSSARLSCIIANLRMVSGLSTYFQGRVRQGMYPSFVCVCLRINFVLSYSPLQPISKSPKDSNLRTGLTLGGGGKVVEGTFNMIYLGLFSS